MVDYEFRIRQFVGSPLKEGGQWKAIDTVPGIYGKKRDVLMSIGYKFAFHLIGQYMTMDLDGELFTSWLSGLLTEHGVRVIPSEIDTCTQAVRRWCDANI